uniref:Uncharacterized protein n=1 Tax=Rhizophora mucronata TaxID=61149 RepID=A0A2P2N3Q2_RHIMU
MKSRKFLSDYHEVMVRKLVACTILFVHFLVNIN